MSYEAPDIDEVLRATLDDHRLSRGERRALGEVLSDLNPDRDRLALLRHRAFELAKAELINPKAIEVLGWLHDVVKVLANFGAGQEPHGLAEAYFSPGDVCRTHIVRQIEQSKTHLDVCVFTITDDRIATAMIDAHERGVAVRVITDDEKSHDRGSDVAMLKEAGLNIRFDRSEHFMHHKFALFDERILVTGSYNWTRSAMLYNQENIAIVGDPRLIHAYQQTFDRLWKAFA